MPFLKLITSDSISFQFSFPFVSGTFSFFTTVSFPAVIEKSPEGNNGKQMRRVTRLLKFYKQSRDSWKQSMPSGFEISVLVDERYVADSNREDVSLYSTMLAIKSRLEYNLEVKHPTRNEMLTDGANDPNTRLFKEKLIEAVDNLQVLFKSDCTRLEALRAWNSVFKHDYWKNLITEEEESEKQKRKEEKAALLRDGNDGLKIAAGILSVGAAAVACEAIAKSVKETRSYGSKKR